MTTPATYDITGYKGDSYELVLTITGKDTGTPIPLTANWAAQIRERPDARNPDASFTIDTANAATGVLRLTLTATQTALLNEGVWDLQCNDNARTYVKGSCTFEQDVTR